MHLARALGALVLGASIASSASCTDRRLVQLENVRREVCRCKDAACVEAALTRMPDKGAKHQAQAQRLANEILSCVAAVGERAPEAAPATPATESTAEPAADPRADDPAEEVAR